MVWGLTSSKLCTFQHLLTSVCVEAALLQTLLLIDLQLSVLRCKTILVIFSYLIICISQVATVRSCSPYSWWGHGVTAELPLEQWLLEWWTCCCCACAVYKTWTRLSGWTWSQHGEQTRSSLRSCEDDLYFCKFREWLILFWVFFPVKFISLMSLSSCCCCCSEL